MKKAFVIYTTRSNETGRLAEFIEAGMKSEGIDVTAAKVSEIEKKGIQFENCDVLILGSPTYKGEMLKEMKSLLLNLEAIDLSAALGGAFGAFGWGGEASLRIYDTMKNVLKIKMVDKPLRVKSSSETGGAIEAKKYGRDIARILKYGREIARMMQ